MLSVKSRGQASMATKLQKIAITVLLGISCALELCRAAQPAPAEGKEFFEQKIEPVLKQHCYRCHSLSAEKLKAGLLLDSREALLKGGDTGPIVAPGDPDKSRLIEALRYANPDLQMPPKEKLTPEQIADFENWVRIGTPYSGDPTAPASYASASLATNHWAFRPVRDVRVPSVGDKRWPKDPLDNFVLAELEERKLAPAPPADKRTLLRRATFDLIGLPPTEDQLQQFLADSAPDAFARLIDQLLGSPHFGERWGRHWLDVARYSDSNGLEVNVPYPNAWRYRDYVINAFYQDKPFDQFVREQIAGDLLPAASDDDRYQKLIGTGFLVLGPKALAESNPAKLSMDVVDEQIDVTTRAFLGLTASCARCHDHKFDPIPTRDYYALAGIFRSTTTLTSGNAPDPLGRRWMERPLVTAVQAKEIEDYNTAVSRLTEALRAAQEHPGGIVSSKLAGTVVDNSAAQLTGRWKESQYSTNYVDKNYLSDANSDKGKMVARFIPKLPHTGKYEVLVSYTPHPNRATNVPVTIQSTATNTTVFINQRLAPRFLNAFVSVGSFEFQAGTNGTVSIANANTKGFVIVDAVQFVPIDEWKLVQAELEQREMETSMARPNRATSQPGDGGVTAMRQPPAVASSSYNELLMRYSEMRSKAPPPTPTAMAVQDGSPANLRIHIRGDIDRLGPEVPRGFLSVVAHPGQTPRSLSAETSGRLELADWIANPQNPLTARVAVNRIWVHLFGRGLVDTPDNFGILGEKPSHPELLDHLARRFIAEGWSTKKMIRAITLSSAYQMSSEFNPKAYSKDPDNRYLWRMNRRRLEAEALRDAILAISGKLDLTVGGSIMPTNTPPIAPDRGVLPSVVSDRRSVYLPVLRNNLPDLFQVFDFADPHTIAGKRHVTSAATQALFMLNNDFVIEQSRFWAESLLRSYSADSDRASAAIQRAFVRPASHQEIERALKFISHFQQSTQGDAENVRRLAWQSFCQVLFASTEFRFLD